MITQSNNKTGFVVLVTQKVVLILSHFLSDVKVMSGKTLPLLFVSCLSFVEGPLPQQSNTTQQYPYLLYKCFSYNLYISENFVNKSNFIGNSNASPSFTCTISEGKFALGITFIKKLHDEVLLPFVIMPYLKKENGQFLSSYSKHGAVSASRSASKMSRENSIKGFTFTTSLSVLSVLCNLAKVIVFSFQDTFAMCMFVY